MTAVSPEDDPSTPIISLWMKGTHFSSTGPILSRLPSSQSAHTCSNGKFSPTRSIVAIALASASIRRSSCSWTLPDVGEGSVREFQLCSPFGRSFGGYNEDESTSLRNWHRSQRDKLSVVAERRGRRMAGDGHGVGLCVGVLLILGGIVSVHGMQEECAVELYGMIFKPTLSQIKTPHAIVEFFVSWNPFCKEYKPHYDRVACLFNDPNAVHEGEVYATKVDCGLESNKGLCARFDIQTYPTLYWGPPEVLAFGGGFSTAKLGLESVDGGTVNTAEKLIQWINKRINKEYSLTDKRQKPKRHNTDAAKRTPPVNSGIWNLPATLHDVEEATAYAFSYMMDLKRMRASSRASFIQFLHLLERHHPSARCRKGSAKVLENLVEWWPLRQPPAEILREQQLCGPNLPRGFWETCDGEGRGYSCGLWMLLHSLTVRVEDFEGSFAITAVEAFVDDFYKCDHCHDLFRNITSRNSADSMSTNKDVVLWLWRTHNKVTELVAREEAKVNGHSPRTLWPPENECPACRDSFSKDSDWDDEAVYIYLMEFYGLKAAEIIAYKGSRVETTAALGVPYWATLGMAMASTGLVVTLCYYSFAPDRKFKLTKRG